MNRALLFAAIGAVLLVAPREARACGSGGGGLYALVYGAMAVGAVDVGLTLWDGGSALASHHPSAGYGVFELVVGAPQLILGGFVLGDTLTHGRTGAQGIAIYTGWMALLVAHASWTIATANPEPPPDHYGATETSPPVYSKRGAPQVALGMTYAPVGTLAQPGFGVVGRF